MKPATPFQIPNQRRGINIPGIPLLPVGVERYPIPAGGSRSIPINEGDKISIIDEEGLQPAELVFFAADGRCDITLIGAQKNSEAPLLKTLLKTTDPAAVLLSQRLQQHGLLPNHWSAVDIFDHQSPAGALRTFDAASDGLLILCTPNTVMLPWQQQVSTGLVLYIHRANPEHPNPSVAIPQPLADPLVDINIQPGNAVAHEVKAGQYIQILDIHGRQCSDFQAFSLRAVENGLEREIDPTTTRSLMGALYPTPGLFAKYFTCDQEALIEIVEDTCGRHDTFGSACTARYYEDIGYPGHVNCTDNINAQMSSFDVTARRSWSAINFFFNTMLDAQNAVIMDDPWSRPGDYVLLRALTDLICVSTACPCDVDPANGWNPTDVQVFTYKSSEKFYPSIGWRKTPEADMEKTKQTPFHDCFQRYSRDFIEYNGYWLANKMTRWGTLNEYWACREKAAIMDLSPLRKYEITGPDAEALMQWCVTRNMKKLAIGQVVYTALCFEHGGMIDDGTVFRLGDNNFRWIGGNDDSGLWLRQQAEQHQFNAWVKTSTDQLCNVAVQGPLSRDILERLLWTPPTQPTIRELPWFRFTIARIADFHGAACVVSRTGYSGELGYEIFCHPKDAQTVFDAIWQVGEPLGMLPLGLAALDMLRIEAGLVFAGYEFSDQTDPFEAGIGFTVPLKSKTDDFIGREALIRRQANPQRRLVGLEIEGGTVPQNGDCIRIGKAQVGEITSAVKSPILGKVIALARLDITQAEPGTAIEIGQLDGQQKRLAACVSTYPHFDPTKARVQGNYS